MTFKFRTYGITFSWEFLRPDWESWGEARGSFWHVTAFGVSFWRNTLPPTTVGERGAW